MNNEKLLEVLFELEAFIIKKNSIGNTKFWEFIKLNQDKHFSLQFLTQIILLKIIQKTEITYNDIEAINIYIRNLHTRYWIQKNYDRFKPKYVYENGNSIPYKK